MRRESERQANVFSLSMNAHRSSYPETDPVRIWWLLTWPAWVSLATWLWSSTEQRSWLDTRRKQPWSNLIFSPRCTLLWFIPMTELQWTEPQVASDNKSDTEGECFTVRLLSWSIRYHLYPDNLKTHLKSAYKELEKAPKTNVSRIDGLVWMRSLASFLECHSIASLEEHSQTGKWIQSCSIETAIDPLELFEPLTPSGVLHAAVLLELSTARLDRFHWENPTRLCSARCRTVGGDQSATLEWFSHSETSRSCQTLFARFDLDGSPISNTHIARKYAT